MAASITSKHTYRLLKYASGDFAFASDELSTDG
jgi:hypothetical protein